MRLIDVLEYSFSDFNSNKFKTLMSSLGIIIGVLAIVVMLTLGEGLYSGISSQFGDLELDTMFIIPVSVNMNGGFGGGGVDSGPQKPSAKFTDRDISLLINTEGVAAVYPRITEAANVTTDYGSRGITIQAIKPQLEDRMSQEIDKGRFLTQSDRAAVVLGSKVANGTFKNIIRPGSYITITNYYTNKSQTYVVAGVLKEMNGSILTGDPNSYIYLTPDGLKGFSDANTYSEIWVRADSVESAQAVSESVKESLQSLHRQEGYTVITQKMFASAIQQIFDLVKYTLAGIGGVSLLVGGIGIMNVMTLTVKERVKEIGLMKAVGATTGNVRVIFLSEAAILGLVSGAIGVVIGGIIAAIVGGLLGMPMVLSLNTILIGLGFGLIITVVAGVYPANQAALLDPIEALRNE